MTRNRMYRALAGTTLSIGLAALLSAGSVKAQTTTNDPNYTEGTTRTTTTTEHRGFDAGWLGLLGLFGLMGRKTVRREEPQHHAQARPMPT